MSLSKTIDLLRSFHQEITLFSCQSYDREYYDFYDPETKTYNLAERVVTNIYREPFVVNFHVCYDFTLALERLLISANIKPQTLADKKDLCGYDFPYRSPVCVDDRLSLLFRRNGIYVCQIKFDCEDHGFVVIVDGDKMTVLSLYSCNFYVVETDINKGLACFVMLEVNGNDNRSFVKEVFGFESYF